MLLTEGRVTAIDGLLASAVVLGLAPNLAAYVLLLHLELTDCQVRNSGMP